MKQKNYLIAEGHGLQVWCNYGLSLCTVIRDGEIIKQEKHCTISEVERITKTLGL